mgnify:CR=1 FL=1
MATSPLQVGFIGLTDQQITEHLWRGVPLLVVATARPELLVQGLYAMHLERYLDLLLSANQRMNLTRITDRAAAVCQRLREVSKTETGIVTSELDPRPLVLATENKIAVILPTFTSHAVFWAPHFDFLHLAPGESRERFYQYLYFTGVDREKFEEELSKPGGTFAAAAFGHERVIPDLAVQVTPISPEEIRQKVAEYETYRTTFTRELAAQHIISYLIVPATDGPDLTNLDRWYQRDEGEVVEGYKLYRVQLRP